MSGQAQSFVLIEVKTGWKILYQKEKLVYLILGAGLQKFKNHTV